MLEEGSIEVKARISGVFYRTPSPGVPSFVEVGSIIKKGETLALLEAMKVFSKVKAPVAGTIAAIRALDEQAVTVGDILFLISRA